MSASFRGGIHPEPHKEFTSRKRVEVLPPPRELIFPMSMHIGMPCEPAVQKGDRVLHTKFGEGSVVAVTGKGSDARIQIEFTAYGVKEFSLSIAPIVKLEDEA